MRPAAPTTVYGGLSPAPPSSTRSGPESTKPGITVAVHGGDSGYTSHGYADDGSASPRPS